MRLLRLLLPVPVLGTLVYCVYGFTLTFGPSADGPDLASRIVYSAGGGSSLVLLILLLAACIKADTEYRSQAGPSEK